MNSQLTAQIRLAQLFKQRLDAFESRMAALEFRFQQSSENTEFSQQFETLIAELQALVEG